MEFSEGKCKPRPVQFLLVTQDCCSLEYYNRREDHHRVYSKYHDPQGVLEIETLSCSLNSYRDISSSESGIGETKHLIPVGEMAD